jgi:hypothetical protein
MNRLMTFWINGEVYYTDVRRGIESAPYPDPPDKPEKESIRERDSLPIPAICPIGPVEGTVVPEDIDKDPGICSECGGGLYRCEGCGVGRCPLCLSHLTVCPGCKSTEDSRNTDSTYEEAEYTRNLPLPKGE